jgi:predicted nucleic acid-binding protein
VVIYLDSAAVVKLIRVEPGSAELVAWLAARREMPLVSSALVEVEVPRALRRNGPEVLPAVPATMARLYRLEIDATVRATAGAFPDPLVRSLDAIHLATALLVRSELETFVTYDDRLLAAAAQIGLPTASPRLQAQPAP